MPAQAASRGTDRHWGVTDGCLLPWPYAPATEWVQAEVYNTKILKGRGRKGREHPLCSCCGCTGVLAALTSPVQR